MLCVFDEKRFNFYGHKIQFISKMISRILHSWSFHVKYLKHAEVSFHKKSYELITNVSSSVHVMFVCVEVLRPSQPNGVMSSAVSLPYHTFTGQS